MISIIIPTHGRPVLLEKTLNSLADCKIPSSYNKLIVAENGSRAGAEILVSQLPDKLNAEYLFVERANKSNALNKALEKLNEDLVFFTDDDVEVSPGILTAYDRAAQEYRSGVFLGGPVNIDQEEEPPNWMKPLLPYSAKGYDLINDRMNSGYIGFNWAAFASDIKKLGGFNPRFGPGSPTGATGQESEMQGRMREKGMKAVDVLDAIVCHKVPKNRCNERWLKKRFYQYGISRGLNEGDLQGTLHEVFRLIKYLIRWGGYLLLLNKMERKKSKMEVITRIGYLKSIIAKLKSNDV